MGRRVLSFLAFLIVGSTAPALCDQAQNIPGSVPILVNPDRRPGEELPPDPAGAIRATRERIAAGDMPGAIRRLSGYVFNHPSDVIPKRFLADLYFRAGDVTRAELLYTDILRDYPGDRETHNRLGTVYATQNKVDQAIKEFEASLPGTDSVADLVQLHQRRGDLAVYRAQVERIAAQYPNSADLQSELGQVYSAMHQPYQATVYFKRALDSDQNSLTALNGLGLSMMDVHDYPAAIAQFQKCLRIEPESFQCLDNMGAAQLEDGSYATAEATLKKAHDIAPERPEPLVNFGYLADTKGDWKKAVAYYAQAIALWPYSREAYVDIGIAYEKHGLYPLAQAALLKGIAAAPDDGRLHVLLGQAYEAQGDRAKAIAQFRAAELSPDPDIVRLSEQLFERLKSDNSGKPQQ